MSVNHSFSTSAGTPHISGVQKKFGIGALRIENGERIASADHADWRLGGGTGDWTIDFWFYPVSWPSGVDFATIISQNVFNIDSQSNWYINFIREGTPVSQLSFNAQTAGVNKISMNTGVTDPFTLNTWSHVAVVRSSLSTLIFVDGINVTSGTDTGVTMPDCPGELRIGNQDIASDPFNIWGVDGNYYLDEIRFSTVARWTSNFTPPTTKYAPQPDDTVLLMHFDENQGSTDFKDVHNDSPQGDLVQVMVI